MGIEALAFCALLVVILILGGLVTIYESFATAPPHSVQSPRVAAQQVRSFKNIHQLFGTNFMVILTGTQ